MHTAPHGRRRRVAIAACMLAITLGVSACGAQAPAPEGDNNAVLSLAITAAPPSFDPAELDEGQGTFVWSSVYETLLNVDNEGQIQPGVAESYEYSDDRKTLTLSIRDGLTFSNGDALTSGDVVATLERTKQTPGVQQSRLAIVDSITAPDESTVVLLLSSPDATLLNYLAQATGVVGHGPTLADESSKLRPIGSGPYEIADSTVDGTTYVLERRDDYWNAEAYPFKTFTVRVIQDQTAIANALQTGEVLAGSVQAPQLPQLEGAGLTVKEITSSVTMMLLLADRNGTLQPALADVRVRQAINMAFDRDLYIKTLFGGYARPTVQSFNINDDAYDESLAEEYTYDPDAAKKLLADAGYPDGFALTMPSTVISVAFEPAITQSMSDIGISVTWEPVPPQNIASSVASAKYPVVLWLEGTNVAGREFANYFGAEAFLNPFRYQNDKLNSLFSDIAAESDDAMRADLYKQATAITVKEALNAPIVSMSTIWITAEDVVVSTDINVPKTIRMFAPAS